MDFQSLGLDARLLRALKKREFDAPTPVQARAIPTALEGRDVVARARTGSGKTLSYLLPALHRVLTLEHGRMGWQALVLVPTRELAEQVRSEAAVLAAHCGQGLTATALLQEGSAARAAAATAGQIVVSTPARIAALLRDGVLNPRLLERSLRTLVLDEADLLLSYGYEEDVSTIAPAIPRSCQCMLLSATTSDDVERLTKLVLQNPVSLDLLKPPASSQDGNKEAGAGTSCLEGNQEGLVTMTATGAGVAAEVEHRRVDLPARCSSAGSMGETTEKLLHLLTLLKLNLVAPKVLIFVNSPDMGMRVRLFLEAFGIRAAVLSAELPLNSRHHLLEEYNRGLFDHLIATDDVHAAIAQLKRSRKDSDGSHRRTKGRKHDGAKKDEEFGVTRGIDFKGVSTVINFDMPSGPQGYVHRVGRTGRAGQAGAAVSLFGPSDVEFAAEVEAALRGGGSADEAQADGGEHQETDGEGARTATLLRPFERITTAAVEGLRYRAEDVARSITKNVIKEARTKDIKAELLNSKRLHAFFEDRPADLALLRHDRPLAAGAAAGAAAAHLKHIPGYLRDPTLQGKSFVGGGGPARSGHLPVRKRRKTEGLDPLRGFLKAPKRGGDRLEEPTEMELRAEAAAKKERKLLKKSKKSDGTTFQPKRNVRKQKARKR